MKRLLYLFFIVGFTPVWAQTTAPSTPEAASAAVETAKTEQAAQPSNASEKAAQTTAQEPAPQAAQKPAAEKTAESAPEKAADPAAQAEKAAPSEAAEDSEEFVTARESVEEEEGEGWVAKKVEYNPTSKRDPMLSPDDLLLLEYREQQRLAAIEAERQRKLAEERRKQEEAERQRQLELARIKDPTREVRNKIKIGGIIGQEVFIGSKIYTVGNSIYGARIVSVSPEEVVFSYKGHKFVRKVQL